MSDETKQFHRDRYQDFFRDRVRYSQKIEKSLDTEKSRDKMSHSVICIACDWLFVRDSDLKQQNQHSSGKKLSPATHYSWRIYDRWVLLLHSHQGCISCGTCSYPELTEDHVRTSAYVKIFRIVTRNAINKSFWRKKDCSWPPLKQICNEYLMKFSENQSAPKLENRKTSSCSPCAPNLLHVLLSRIAG